MCGQDIEVPENYSHNIPKSTLIVQKERSKNTPTCK
jgi:hypothetical protein